MATSVHTPTDTETAAELKSISLVHLSLFPHSITKFIPCMIPFVKFFQNPTGFNQIQLSFIHQKGESDNFQGPSGSFVVNSESEEAEFE